MRFRKNIFILTHSVFDKRFKSLYQDLIENLYKDYSLLLDEQNRRLQKAVKYAYHAVPYYTRLFDQLKIKPADIPTRKDLEHLPILSKKEIIENYDDFTPKDLDKHKYFTFRSSGSTGDPFTYRLSKYDRLLSGCLLYRGWLFGGYELGDKMVFLAGSSLSINTKNELIKWVHEFTRNVKKLSSFDMDEENLFNYRKVINEFQPEFIRGYAVSIFKFAQWLDENKLSVYNPKGVFTTAEKLLPDMRKTIRDVFQCDVYDNYGLNDGGIGAYELSDHSGMRIDTERAVLEVVDEEGKQIHSGTGRIIGTSLWNTAFPFIRYDGGDYGTISVKPDGTQVLTEIIGRQQEILQTPEGKFIHGVFFGFIFREMDSVRNFQVIQTDLDHITIKIVPDNSFDKSELETISRQIKERSEKWQVQYEIVDEIETAESGKYHSVINKVKTNE